MFEKVFIVQRGGIRIYCPNMTTQLALLTSRIVKYFSSLPPPPHRPYLSIRSINGNRNLSENVTREAMSLEKYNITPSDFAFVVLVVQHTMHKRQVVLYGLSGYAKFLQITS